MTESTVAGGPQTAPKSLAQRFVGVLLAPRETFENVVLHPRWAGMFILVLLISAVLIAGFLSTGVGQQAWLDQAVRTSENWGRTVSDQQYQAMQKIAPYAGLIALGQVLIVSPIVTLVLAAILFGVFNALMGGRATFKQVFTVLVHSAAVTCIQQIIVMPLNYARETMSSATNLAVLLPMLEEGSFPARLAGMIDVFIIWWVVVLSIGLAVLFKRKTAPIATGLFIVYGVIALAIALFFGGRGGA